MGKNIVQILFTGSDKSRKAFASATGSLSRFRAEMVAMGPQLRLVATVAAGAIGLMGKRTLDAAEAAEKASQQLGLTVEALTGLHHGAGLAGVSVTEMEQSLKQLAKNSEDAARGTGEAVVHFRELGIEVLTANGELRKGDEILKDFADRLSEMEDGTRKTAIAVDVFGRTGSRLIPLLNQGRKGIEDYHAEAEKLGIVLETKTAKQAAKFKDQLTVLNARFRGLFISALDQMLPALLSVAGSLNLAFDNAKSFAGAIEFATNWLKGMLATTIAVGESLITLGRTLGSFTGEISVEGFKGIGVAGFKAAKGLVDDFEDAKDQIIKLFEEPAIPDAPPGPAAFSAPSFLDSINQFEEELNTRLRIQSDFDNDREKTETEYDAFRRELDEAYRQGQAEQFFKLIESQRATNAVLIEDTQVFLDTYEQMWRKSHAGIWSFAASASQTAFEGISRGLSNVILQAQTAAQAVKALGQSMLRMVVDFIAQKITAFAIEKTMAALGLGLLKTSTSASLASAASLSAAWAAPATGALISTFGAAGAAAANFPALVSANVAAATSLSKVSGAFHSGIDRVPREGTFLLSRGERVIQPTANRDLTEFLRATRSAPAGGPTVVEILLDGRALASGISEMSDDGRLVISAGAIA